MSTLQSPTPSSTLSLLIITHTFCFCLKNLSASQKCTLSHLTDQCHLLETPNKKHNLILTFSSSLLLICTSFFTILITFFLSLRWLPCRKSLLFTNMMHFLKRSFAKVIFIQVHCQNMERSLSPISGTSIIQTSIYLPNALYPFNCSHSPEASFSSAFPSLQY